MIITLAYTFILIVALVIYIFFFVAKLISISMRNGKYSIGIGFIDVDKLLNILSIDLIIGQMYIPCFKHVSSHRTVNG